MKITKNLYRYIIIIEVVLIIVASMQRLGIVPYTKYSLIYVPTGSMEPAIHARTLCVVERVDDDTPLEDGDIVVYHNEEVWGNTRIIHRIVFKDKYFFQTKGDANNFYDPGYITRENILFKYIVSLN